MSIISGAGFFVFFVLGGFVLFFVLPKKRGSHNALFVSYLFFVNNQLYAYSQLLGCEKLPFCHFGKPVTAVTEQLPLFSVALL